MSPVSTTHRARTALVRFALLFTVTGAAVAAPPEWGADFGAGLLYSDNVTRAPEGLDATLGSVDASAQLLKATRSFMVDAEVAGTYRYFFDNQYGSDFLAQARIDSSWTPIPERFMWVLSDNYGQVADSAAFASSLLPAERQDVNVFSTGPVMALPLPWESRIELSGLYSDVYYEQSDLANTRKSARAALEHNFSRRQSIYLSGAGSRRDYKSDAYTDFDLVAVTAGLLAMTNRSTIGIEVGVEELRGETITTRRGQYFDINIDRRLSPRSAMYVRYISRFADSADVFALDQTLEADLGDTSNVQLNGEPIRQKRAGAGVEWEGSRTNVSIGLTWSTEEVEPISQQPALTPLLPDREIYGVLLAGSRRLSARTTLGASAYYLRELRTDVLNPKQDDLAASLELNVNLTNVLSLRGQIEHYARLNTGAGDYKENRVLVTLRYVPRAVRQNLPSFVERRIGSRRGLEGESAESNDTRPGSDSGRPRPPVP